MKAAVLSTLKGGHPRAAAAVSKFQSFPMPTETTTHGLVRLHKYHILLLVAWQSSLRASVRKWVSLAAREAPSKVTSGRMLGPCGTKPC